VQAALHAGVTYFDTAPLYGHGLSEGRLGSALRDVPRRSVTISTKVGRLLVPTDGAGDEGSIFADTPPLRPHFDLSAAGIRRSWQESLRRIGTDHVDVLFLHDPDDHHHEAISSALPELLRLREEGAVGAVGVGMNQTEMLDDLVERFDLDAVLVAGRCSLLDQRASASLLPRCEARGVSVIVGGVFNSGLLADPRPGARFDYAPADRELLERARALEEIARGFGVPLRSAALHYPFTQPAVASVLVGVRSEREVQENVASLRTGVPPELWAELRDQGLLPAVDPPGAGRR
jgi:D-threo-aldose 1-dehydrogenase